MLLQIGDSIFGFLVFMMFFGMILFLINYYETFKYYSYPTKKLVYKYGLIGIIIAYSILNMIFTIFPISVNAYIILYTIINVLFLIVLIRDEIIVKEKQSRYIFLLQKEATVNQNISHKFSISISDTDFNNQSEDISKIFKKTRYEGKQILFINLDNENVILVPESDNIKELRFYEEWLNMNLKQGVIKSYDDLLSISVPVYKNKEIFDFIDFMIHSKQDHILKYIEKHKFKEWFIEKKWWFIIPIIVIISIIFLMMMLNTMFPNWSWYQEIIKAINQWLSS